jgi:hypothetical protein
VPAHDKIEACAVSQESTNVASVTITLFKHLTTIQFSFTCNLNIKTMIFWNICVFGILL